MVNPITQNKNHLIAYFLFWVLIAVLQSLLVYWVKDLTWWQSMLDGAVYAILFGFIGLSIWFVVRYTGLEIKHLWNALINHLAAASILIFLWLLIGNTIIALFMGKPVALKTALLDYGLRMGLGFVYYVIVALNYYLLIFYQNFKEKQISELEIKSMLKESELSMLKAQLNPHFIFNSLNSISSLTLTQPEQAHEMIVKLSTFLRHTIGQSESDLVTISKEIETIGLYLDIEKSRFGEKLKVNIEGLEELPVGLKVPNLILQPLVENAIKYGVYDLIETGEIKIQLSYDQTMLKITITNNYSKQPTGKKGKGIGLQNVKGRLDYIYEQNDLLKTSKTDDNFVAVLTIPQLKT